MTIDDRDVHYGPLGPSERELRLLGEVHGARVLELGCGAGQNSIALARRGADVVGVDFAPEQLAAGEARAAALQLKVRFLEGDISRLDLAALGKFDIVLSSFAVEYVEDLQGVCELVAAVLNADGRFVLCDLHPFVSGGDVVGATVEKLADTIHYFECGPRTFEWDVAGGRATLTRFHRTLEDYIRALTNAGLGLTELREPKVLVSDASDSSPIVAYWDETIRQQLPVWSRFPYTLILIATKDPASVSASCSR